VTAPATDRAGNAAATRPPILELRDLSAAYGPFRALFGVSLAVREGSVLALLGSNGAGKTTIARVCSGLLQPTSGRLLFEGQDVTGRKAYQLARMGITHAPEGRSVFASLSVEENLILTFRRAVGRGRAGDALDRAFTLFPRLGDRRRQIAGTLSGGEQRMLALARVLPVPPKLLICDELSLGLAPIIVEEVYRTLRTIRESGTSLLIVEQHVHHALEIADDAAVLTKGQVTLCRPASELGDLAEQLLPAARGDLPEPTRDGHEPG
jgi:branched-chain amino acid transport system ATP-binding protein